MIAVVERPRPNSYYIAADGAFLSLVGYRSGFLGEGPEVVYSEAYEAGDSSGSGWSGLCSRAGADVADYTELGGAAGRLGLVHLYLYRGSGFGLRRVAAAFAGAFLRSALW